MIESTKNEFLFFSLGIFLTFLVWLLSIVGILGHLTNKIIFLVLFLACTPTILFRKQNVLKKSVISKHEKLAALGALIIILPSWISILASPLTWDEIAYSASFPKAYAAARNFFYISSYGTWSAFPQNYETITTLSLIFLKSTALSILLNIFSFLCLGYAIYKLCKFFALDEKLSLITALFFLVSTSIIDSVGLVKNDLFLAFIQSFALFCLLKYIKTKKNVFILLLGLASGSALGTKYTDIFFFASVSLVFGIYIMFYMKKITPILNYLLLTIIFALPWYLRNWQIFKNPFYPIANQYFGPNAFNSTYMKLFHEHSWTAKNFNYDNGDFLHYFLSIIKLNNFFCIIAIIGLLITFGYKYKNEIYLNILKLFIFFYFLLVYRFGFWEGRYHIIIMVALSPFFCITLVKLFQFLLLFKDNFFSFRKKPILTISFKLIVLCIVLFGLLTPQRKNFILAANYFKLDKAEFINSRYGEYDLTRYINNHFNDGGVVAFANSQPFYFLEVPYFFIHPLNEYGNISEAINDDEKFFKFIKKSNIHYIVLRFNLNDSTYNREQAPTLNNWHDQLYNRVGSYLSSGRISLIKKYSDLDIYRVN